ncbi:MAG: hypothetical protein INQ03_13125 [Candidatus Heimdallarchaeota archaeon]|nr:hypothetical protein [Candidatus Heimdallarchaeota archaeon]
MNLDKIDDLDDSKGIIIIDPQGFPCIFVEVVSAIRIDEIGYSVVSNSWLYSIQFYNIPVSAGFIQSTLSTLPIEGTPSLPYPNSKVLIFPYFNDTTCYSKSISERFSYRMASNEVIMHANVQSALSCARELFWTGREKQPFDDKLISIEGFSIYAPAFTKYLSGKYKLVAISTEYGTLSSEEGMDIHLLLDLFQKHGEEFIYHTPYKISEIDQIFSIKCHIFFIGATVITNELAGKIKLCRPTVIPLSNHLYSPQGLDVLETAGVSCYPDFVSGSGAIIAELAIQAGIMELENICTIVNHIQQSYSRDLLRAARACGIPTSLYIKAKETVQNNKYILDYEKKEQDIKTISINFIAEHNLGSFLP